MSYTPRTDLQAVPIGRWKTVGPSSMMIVPASFARELEREIVLLKESRAAAVEQEQKSRVECNRLRGELKSLRKLM